MKFFQKQRGVILIVSITILAILSVMGVSFVKISLLEKQTSSNHVSGLQSRMMAETGIDVALLKIQAEFNEQGISDWQKTSWIYRDDLQVALENSLHPSFSGSENVGSEIYRYRVKVVDANSLVNINSPHKEGLMRILSALFTFVGIENNLPLNEIIAQKIIQNRPPVFWNENQQIFQGGYKSIAQMFTLAGVSREQAIKIKPYLTKSGWANSASCLYDEESENRLRKSIDVPINLNLAPKEIIAANFFGLEAIDQTSINADLALEVAQRIVEEREKKPFSDWDQYRRFLKTISNLFSPEQGGIANFSPAQAELIFLATVPYVHSKQNRTPWYYTSYISPYGGYESSDIRKMNAKFILGSAGVFEIESIGEKLSSSQLTSQRKLSTVVKMAEIYQHTSQAEFEKARLNFTQAAPSTPLLLEGKAPNDKWGNLIIGTKTSWKQEQLAQQGELTPFGYVGSVSLEGETPLTSFYFTAPDGDNPNDFNETITLPEGAVRYKRKIESAQGNIWLYFRYENGNFVCSTILVNEVEDPPANRLSDWDILYEAKVDPNWRKNLEEILREVYRSVAHTVLLFNGFSNIDNPPLFPLFGDVYTQGGYYEDEFVAFYMKQVTAGLSFADVVSLNLPLPSQVDGNLFSYEEKGGEGEGGEKEKSGDWAGSGNETIAFNLTDYIADYVDFWPGVFTQLPKRIPAANVQRTDKLEEYIEGVAAQAPPLHGFDRTRWEKVLKSPQIKEGRTYRVSLQLPKGDTLETNFTLEELDFLFDEGKQQFSQESFTLVGKGKDLPEAMGATINVWHGPSPYHALETEYPFNDQILHQGEGHIFQGKFSLSMEGKPWKKVGTALWIGYTPVKDQTIKVLLAEEELKSNGERGDKKIFFTSPLDISYTIELSSKGGTTPFFEGIQLIVCHPPVFLEYQWE